jgi:hypothetical protein
MTPAALEESAGGRRHMAGSKDEGSVTGVNTHHEDPSPTATRNAAVITAIPPNVWLSPGRLRVGCSRPFPG